jgi:hypothetical protein
MKSRKRITILFGEKERECLTAVWRRGSKVSQRSVEKRKGSSPAHLQVL